MPGCMHAIQLLQFTLVQTCVSHPDNKQFPQDTGPTVRRDERDARASSFRRDAGAAGSVSGEEVFIIGQNGQGVLGPRSINNATC